MGERKRGGRPSSVRPFLPRSGSCGSWGGEGPRGQGETRAQLPGPGRRPPRSPWGGFGLRFAAAGTDLEAEPVPRGSRGRRGGHDEHPPAPSRRSGAAVRWPAGEARAGGRGAAGRAGRGAAPRPGPVRWATGRGTMPAGPAAALRAEGKGGRAGRREERERRLPRITAVAASVPFSPALPRSAALYLPRLSGRVSSRGGPGRAVLLPGRRAAGPGSLSRVSACRGGSPCPVLNCGQSVVIRDGDIPESGRSLSTALGSGLLRVFWVISTLLVLERPLAVLSMKL